MISFFEKRKILSVAITVIIAITIFYVSSLTFESSSGKGGFELKSIFYHIFAFFFLAFFLLISLLRGHIKKTETVFGIIFLIIYAFSDEFHQRLVPTRTMSLTDIFYDSFGIIFAAAIYLSLLRYRNVKNPQLKVAGVRSSSRTL